MWSTKIWSAYFCDPKCMIAHRGPFSYLVLNNTRAHPTLEAQYKLLEVKPLPSFAPCVTTLYKLSSALRSLLPQLTRTCQQCRGINNSRATPSKRHSRIKRNVSESAINQQF